VRTKTSSSPRLSRRRSVELTYRRSAGVPDLKTGTVIHAKPHGYCGCALVREGARHDLRRSRRDVLAPVRGGDRLNRPRGCATGSGIASEAQVGDSGRWCCRTRARSDCAARGSGAPCRPAEFTWLVRHVDGGSKLAASWQVDRLCPRYAKLRCGLSRRPRWERRRACAGFEAR
jgi:hypothetical protein